MKTKLLMLSLVLIFTGTLMAQNSEPAKGCKKDQKCCPIEGLTPEQEKAIDLIKKDMHAQNKNLKADLDIKEAELNKLMIQDKPDMIAIDSKIDEIGSIRLQIQKNRTHSRLQIRGLLNEDQKIQFDKKMMKCKGDGAECGHGGMQQPMQGEKPCMHNASPENKPCNHGK